ncbi:hypothetical protein GEOBRER4_n2305 [Citrifermentans bremense]|uniref:Uncharacterized protein n=1 Tax=Citrifermentans bremense TaxID=60035 RepID=A0A7R7IYB5_9BACT|nr:hypothetical protein GEOBRER4_n2305 [Citrifermentans bremense]
MKHLVVFDTSVDKFQILPQYRPRLREQPESIHLRLSKAITMMPPQTTATRNRKIFISMFWFSS